MGPTCEVNKPHQLIDLALSIESLLAQVQADERQCLRMNFASAYNSQQRTHKAAEQRRTYLKVERTRIWLKDNNLICTREDKTKIVIMPANNYDNMLSDYMVLSGAKLLHDDPTLKLQNRLAALLRKNGFPPCWKCKLLPNPA